MFEQVYWPTGIKLTYPSMLSSAEKDKIEAKFKTVLAKAKTEMQALIDQGYEKWHVYDLSTKHEHGAEDGIVFIMKLNDQPCVKPRAVSSDALAQVNEMLEIADEERRRFYTVNGQYAETDAHLSAWALIDYIRPMIHAFDANPRQHITETDDERASRTRLADLWQAKNEAYDDYQTASADDYDACERWGKAASAYASASCGYIAGIRYTPSTVPLVIVDATTTVELARAREPFKRPDAELDGLYAACRDALGAQPNAIPSARASVLSDDASIVIRDDQGSVIHAAELKAGDDADAAVKEIFTALAQKGHPIIPVMTAKPIEESED